MNSISKLSFAATGVFALAFAIFGITPVRADSPGQLTGGPNVYQVKNLTAGGDYTSSVNVACNDVIQYSIMLHNAAFGGLTNVVVSANLAGGTVTAIPAEGASTGTSGSVTVNVASSGSLAYQSGSSTLYNSSGAVIRTLPDTITSGGVNIGDISGSTTEFVNFRAKSNCPVTPVATTPTPIGKGAAQPAVLPNTGVGDVLGIFTGASAAGAAGHYIFARRRA